MTTNDDSIAEAVRTGLRGLPKTLPPFLFYDAAGSALFDRITELPEYYLTRAERSIFQTHAEALIAELTRGAKGTALADAPLAILELGAGSASKTQTLLSAFATSEQARTRARYFPADVSPTALDEAEERLSREVPGIATIPMVATHGEALASMRRWEGPIAVLFIGSSIGNYEDDDALSLLEDIARTIRGRGALVLGTDLKKSPDLLIPAYDDAQGVTAAFNKNVLARINRELGGTFALERFRHVARWNERASRVEMHLESLAAQRVRIEGLGLDVHFDEGETIHTESSHKYDEARIDRLFERAGLVRTRTFKDDGEAFAVHVARTRTSA